jgi:hypothetical protein
MYPLFHLWTRYSSSIKNSETSLAALPLLVSITCSSAPHDLFVETNLQIMNNLSGPCHGGVNWPFGVRYHLTG